ncbi:MAG TPA: gluconate 2-dehydrogenase subunit 3 family protein [Gemmatimonadaceae bacterium]|nr:gluconate 2-dehydrogenase subunit 3 family protein [Gemmatimonadaceae bacterium]
MDRRESLRAMAGTVGLLALGRHAHAIARIGALRVLSPHQDAIVLAACERIIPATETPGAAEVLVDRFIDTMLADWYTGAEQKRFLAGLAELDEQRFLERTTAEQAAIIEQLDGEATDGHWFGMLKYLTIWGYYTSEAAQARELGNWPMPWRYDGNAPYAR